MLNNSKKRGDINEIACDNPMFYRNPLIESIYADLQKDSFKKEKQGASIQPTLLFGQRPEETKTKIKEVSVKHNRTNDGHPHASIKTALEYRKSMMPPKLPLSISLAGLGKQFGVGVALYFWMLRYVGLSFILFALPATIWVAFDRYIDYGSIATISTQTQGFADVTIAGIPIPSLSSKTLESKLAVYLNGHKLFPSRESYLIFVQCMDIVGSVLFILLTTYFAIWRSRTIAEQIDMDTLEVSDYTVQLSGIPDETNVNELANFLSKKFGEVAEIQLVHGDLDLLAHYRERANLREALQRAKTLGNEATKLALEVRLRTVEESIKLMLHMGESSGRIVAAFVTFMNEYSKKRCLRVYRNLAWSTYAYVDKKYLFNGNLLYANPADAPNNIKFENLAYNGRTRFIRKVLAAIGICCILAGSFFGSSELRKITKQNGEQLVFSNDRIPATACATALQVCSTEISQQSGIPMSLLYGSYMSISLTTADPSGIQQATALSDLQNNAICYSCYCQGLADNGHTTTDPIMSRQCGNFFVTTYIYRIMYTLTVLFIAIVNFILRAVISLIVRLTNYPSKTQEENSRMFWVFVSQFLNTAILPVISNISAYGDFTLAWYTDVGTAIFYSLLVQGTLMPIAMHFVGKIWFYFVRIIKENRSVIQEELNRAYAAPWYMLSVRMAEVAVVACSSLLYGAGMPLLLWSAAISILAVFQWVDKYELLRECQEPSRHSAKIIAPFYWLLVWSVVAHLLVGGWMQGINWAPPISNIHSVPTITANGKYVTTSNHVPYWISRILQANSFGMFLTAGIIILVIVLYRIVHFVTNVAHTKTETISTYVENTPSFDQGLRRNLLTGIKTYSLVEHPEYKSLYDVNTVGAIEESKVQRAYLSRILSMRPNIA